MARKLTDEEREKINQLTGVLCKALPAAQRNYGAGIASALVRIPRPQVTMRDLGRICGKYGEDKAMLVDMVKAEVLDPVEVTEGPAAWTLRSFAPAVGPDPEKGDSRASDGPGPQRDESPAAEHAAEEPRPATDAECAAEAEQVDAPPQTRTEKPRPGRGSRRRAAARKADSAPAEPASEPPEPAPAPAPEAPAEPPEPAPSPATDAPEEPSPAPAPTPEQPEPEAPAPTPAPPLSSARRGRLRRRSSRSARHDDGAPQGKQPQGLADIPYVRRGGEAEAQIREKIVALDPRFWMNGWLLSHPAAYTLYEREICAINEALEDGTIVGEITRRQLAYQMGGDEKFFEYGSDGLKLLRSMGVEDIIRHRPLPKSDVMYFAPRRRKHMRVLVTENLDPWLDVRDLMYEDGRSLILGERIHAVVLGGGTPVLEHNRLALLLDNLGADELEVLYWGDIDRAGLEIYAKLRAMLEPTYSIAPFTAAYQLMADRAAERFPDPLLNETTGQVNIELADPALICDGLTPEAAAYSAAVLENCRLIPQEILTRRDL